MFEQAVSERHRSGCSNVVVYVFACSVYNGDREDCVGNESYTTMMMLLCLKVGCVWRRGQWVIEGDVNVIVGVKLQGERRVPCFRFCVVLYGVCM